MGKEIVHNWAHQLKTHGRSGNISFNKDCFYSYRTVIGQVVTLPNGQNIYLLNTGHYSNTTSNHQHYVRMSIPTDAPIFSVSCHNFIYNWSGFYQFGKPEQTKLVTQYLAAQLKVIKEFSQSTSLKTEKEFSLHWYSEAQKLMALTNCCTFNQLIRTDNLTLKMRGAEDPTKLRSMIKILANLRGNIKSNLLLIVDAVCGPHTYTEYVKRTKGARSAEYTRTINRFLGFQSGGYVCTYWEPYSYKNTPSAKGIYLLKGYVEGGLGKNDIHKHRKAGDYIAFLHKIKQENFRKNLEIAEAYAKQDRKKEAKRKLERHLGLTGFHCYLSYKIKTFNYNGTLYTYKHYNQEHPLTNVEYAGYCRLSPREQETWRHTKKQWMLQTLLEEERQIEEAHKRAEAEALARKQAEEQYQKLLIEKAGYIKELEARGDEGIRQLWHEGLKKNLPFGKDNAFFHGGNALLRIWGGNVETSKGIRVSPNECKRLWKLVNLWHQNNKQFVPDAEKVQSLTSRWSISRYQHDIMVSGCHAIAYVEMEYIAKQLKIA